MFIRQIALVARDLDPAVEELCAVLGVEVCFHDPGVGEFGLKNALMPIGDTFLEVVCPVEDGTTAGRFLDRRGGDGGYMVLFQTQDLAADRLRISNLGVRIVWEINLDDISAFHMHPRDLGGAIVSIDHPQDPKSWRWAGPQWQEKVRTERVSRIVGAEIQSDDPAGLAARWAEVLGLEARSTDGGHVIPLATGAVRFVPDRDGRGVGVSGFDVTSAAPDRIRQAARERGLDCGPDYVQVCGTRIGLV
jgi:hypothetical protein